MNNEYVAGFFDGEGCVMLAKQKGKGTYGFHIVPTLVIAQRDKYILESIRDHLSTLNIGCFIALSGRETLHRLVIFGAKRCIKFCNIFTDLTIVKHEQLRLMKEYINKRFSLPKNVPYDDEDFAIIDKITSLKHSNIK